MKFVINGVLFLLLLVLSILAGCTQPQSPVSTPAPAVLTTAGTGTNLSQLMLSPREYPFIPVSIRTQVPDMRDPTISQFGGIRGLAQYAINQPIPSNTSTQIGQMIVEYPQGKASLAYDAFVNQTRNADQSQYTLTWLSDPGIGEKSSAFTVTDRTGKNNPMVMIVYVKSGFMESVTMIAPSEDARNLSLIARTTAAKMQ